MAGLKRRNNSSHRRGVAAEAVGLALDNARKGTQR